MNPRTPVAPTAANHNTISPTRAMLHITNGQSVIELMREAGLTGAIVPWDDVLHEGPVPIGLNPAALRERRAEFLASCGWGSADALARSLGERDATLERALRDTSLPIQEIVLWFEHDLYDQLQLLQILDRLPVDAVPRVSMVPDDDYLGLPPSPRRRRTAGAEAGQAASKLRDLFSERREVTTAQRMAARDAWDAFRSPDPRAIVDVLPRVGGLAHMRQALLRHLQQFPSIENGLSRTEQQALEVIATGVTKLGDIYERSHHQREAAIFMGDAGFLVHLSALLRSPAPLLHATRRPTELTLDDHVEITDAGKRVLHEKADRVVLCGIDRWLGGVYLTGTGPVWRWDAGTQRLRLA